MTLSAVVDRDRKTGRFKPVESRAKWKGGISLSQDLLDEIDLLVDREVYPNRSAAIEELLAFALKNKNG